MEHVFPNVRPYLYFEIYHGSSVVVRYLIAFLCFRIC